RKGEWKLQSGVSCTRYQRVAARSSQRGAAMIYEISVIAGDGTNHTNQTYKVEVGANGQAKVNGRAIQLDATLQERDVLSLIIGGHSGGRSYEVRRDGANGDALLNVNGSTFRVEVRDPRSLRGQRDRTGGTSGA